jgi:dephospho-CoA kinase
MKTIGLVGGIASGKSLVGQMLVDRGAALLDADRAGHVVLAEDEAVRAAIRDRWGDGVFHADGRVDRRAVAERVFGDSATASGNRVFLEGLLHPKIRERLEAEGERYRSEGRAAVVLDAALLFEAGWESSCDLVVFVDAPRDLRLKRAALRGWSEAEFAAREAAQWPVEQKRQAADVVIPNAESEETLQQAVGDFWERHVAI